MKQRNKTKTDKSYKNGKIKSNVDEKVTQTTSNKVSDKCSETSYKTESDPCVIKEATEKTDVNRAVPEVPENNNKTETNNTWHHGVCKWFNSTKGWGFINIKEVDNAKDEEAPGGDIFVYQSAIKKEGFRSLVAGEEVQFTVIKRAKGWEAKEVRTVESEAKMKARRGKKMRCFNCGNITRHLAADCPKPPLPKRCHNCKVKQFKARISNVRTRRIYIYGSHLGPWALISGPITSNQTLNKL